MSHAITGNPCTQTVMEIERSSSNILNLDLAGIGKRCTKGNVCGVLSCGKVPYIRLFPFQKTKKKKRSEDA